ncbi:MATE family efflux transporter [Ruminococcus sp. OA3]|uniref:MATE family efflux transporter n=1 Tax=Ruminococcus sp. OA3 TaxID=2914164 RepID=UPI001F051A4A|nr:MATE family efflux transporter [Ruminococcus sp. OA3]MCH1983368.1 MATE family efflux transporter [Ruminococcus sp. OA3]
MEKQSCLKEFVRYSSLNVLGMTGLSCYILADTFFVSKGLGANGLAALNLAIPVYSFIHGTGMMLGMGGATKYSIFKGQKAFRNSNLIFTNTGYLAAVFAAVFMVIGIFFSKNVTLLLGADTEVFAMTNTYLKIILLFAPAFIMNDILICFVRNDGNPRLSMNAMLGGSMLNIILDYVFIFPFDMGIFGAVLATGLSPVISMIILSGHFLKRKNNFCFEKVAPHAAMIGYTLSLGFPSLVTEVSSGVVIIVFNMIILNIQGNIGIAAYGVIANLSLVVIAVYTGIAQGMQPLISRAYGQNDKSTVRQVRRYALSALFMVSCVICLTVFLLASPIAGIFNSEGSVRLQDIAVYGLRLYFIAAPFVGYNIVLLTFFTSTEKAVWAHLLSLLRGLILIIPMAFLLSSLAGITGVWLAFPVTECLVAVLGIILKIKTQTD